jgi:hypothetical protein
MYVRRWILNQRRFFDVLDELFSAERTPAASDSTDQLDTMTQSKIKLGYNRGMIGHRLIDVE